MTSVLGKNLRRWLPRWKGMTIETWKTIAKTNEADASAFLTAAIDHRKDEFVDALVPLVKIVANHLYRATVFGNVHGVEMVIKYIPEDIKHSAVYDAIPLAIEENNFQALMMFREVCPHAHNWQNAINCAMHWCRVEILEALVGWRFSLKISVTPELVAGLQEHIERLPKCGILDKLYINQNLVNKCDLIIQLVPADSVDEVRGLCDIIRDATKTK